MPVLRDHGLNLVAPRGKEAAVLIGACSVAGVFGRQVSQIPYAIVQRFGIEVDKRNLFG